MAEAPSITVVLADDHAIVREGFAALYAANGMTILGQASDGPSALEMILNLKPDFAILDLHMPGMNGRGSHPAPAHGRNYRQVDDPHH